jgi:2-phospho-L-lactate/phosphoenolpyruvate guanylyltransferase
MKIAALIPVKTFRNAKQRLSPLLDATDREALAEAMFRDVLRQVLLARCLHAIFVVTGDDAVAEITLALGAEVIREAAERGETDAVDFARRQLKAAGWEAVLIIPGDMPLLRAQDIDEIVAQLPDEAAAPFALLVPSHDRMGTNALLLAPPDVIKLRFGYDSFTYHMAQISAQKLPLRFCENERVALDIDEPKDLQRFLATGAEDGEAFCLARQMINAALAKSRRSGGA